MKGFLEEINASDDSTRSKGITYFLAKSSLNQVATNLRLFRKQILEPFSIAWSARPRSISSDFFRDARKSWCTIWGNPTTLAWCPCSAASSMMVVCSTFAYFYQSIIDIIVSRCALDGAHRYKDIPEDRANTCRIRLICFIRRREICSHGVGRNQSTLHKSLVLSIANEVQRTVLQNGQNHLCVNNVCRADILRMQQKPPLGAKLGAESKEAHFELGEVAGPKPGVQPLAPPHDPATLHDAAFFSFSAARAVCTTVLVQILLKGSFPSAVYICGGR
jgi:hypothetical protein